MNLRIRRAGVDRSVLSLLGSRYVPKHFFVCGGAAPRKLFHSLVDRRIVRGIEPLRFGGRNARQQAIARFADHRRLLSQLSVSSAGVERLGRETRAGGMEGGK